MKFSWDKQKAKRNERKHGVSFPLAQEAFETGMGVPLGDQLQEGEWRTLLIAPHRGTFLLAIVFTIRDEGDLQGDTDSNQAPETWDDAEVIIRIISARKATTEEEGFYFGNRLSLSR